MKTATLVVSTLLVIGLASPAHAQLGSVLGKAKKIGDKAADAKQTMDDLKFTEKEERDIGERVSMMLREKYGVVQDKNVTRYVTLMGTALAQSSSRPKIDWTFIVLDTDGVNAFATPGGLVHVTKGLLGLLKNEAELAGVLGHEITHVTAKHSIRFIQQSKSISTATSAAAGGSASDYLVAKAAERLGHYFLDSEFSRQDESEADEVGIRLASKLGYAPGGLADALKKLAARNSGRSDKNGMFASHPSIKDRIAAVEKQIKSEKLPGTATVAARYAQHITYDVKAVTEITTNVEGAAGLATGDKKKEDAKKPDEAKKKGGLLGSLSRGKQSQGSQQTASAGARGGIPDRDAVGGPVKSPVSVKVTAAEIEAFKKGIVA